MPLQRIARAYLETLAAAYTQARRVPAESKVGRLISFEDRPSDSPFIERVWRSHSNYAGMFQSMAAPYWGMVVTRLQGKITLTVRGPETRATMAECPAEGEWMGILFKAGTFIPRLRPGNMRDRKDAPMPQAGAQRFWLQGSAWEYPDYENAEAFSDRLARAGVIVSDPKVADLLQDETPNLTKRTAERRVLHATGLNRGLIHQIGRARRATCLLRSGRTILDVVHETGYYDQAHLTRSLNRFVGQTPKAIAAGEKQLSLLYNTQEA